MLGLYILFSLRSSAVKPSFYVPRDNCIALIGTLISSLVKFWPHVHTPHDYAIYLSLLILIHHCIEGNGRRSKCNGLSESFFQALPLDCNKWTRKIAMHLRIAEHAGGPVSFCVTIKLAFSDTANVTITSHSPCASEHSLHLRKIYAGCPRFSHS
jgi:hypothetical protein